MRTSKQVQEGVNGQFLNNFEFEVLGGPGRGKLEVIPGQSGRRKKRQIVELL